MTAEARIDLTCQRDISVMNHNQNVRKIYFPMPVKLLAVRYAENEGCWFVRAEPGIRFKRFASCTSVWQCTVKLDERLFKAKIAIVSFCLFVLGY